MKIVTLFTLTLITFCFCLYGKKAPNFILIYADDLGYTQTSVSMMKDRPDLGHALHQTPNLEKLAKRGMRFSNAYCPSPVCTSSRASIQFGMTTARVGCVSIHDVVMNKKQVDFKKKLSEIKNQFQVSNLSQLIRYCYELDSSLFEKVLSSISSGLPLDDINFDKQHYKNCNN